MLIYSSSTHNFINYKLAKDLNLSVFPTQEFQVMIVDRRTINCLGKCHSIKLSMGDLFLDCPMISIQMGSVDVVLGVQWLQSLGTMALNFQYLFMRFSSKGKEIDLRDIQWKLSKVISSNSMKKLLKKGHHGVIAQLCSLDVQTYISSTPMDLQIVIKNDSKVFGEIPKGLPPTQDHDHAINLQPISVPPKIKPYRYPYAQTSEIEHMIQEILEVSIIQPRQISFYPLVVMVTNKDGSWLMCPNYRKINKMNITYKIHIPVIDELLDELYGEMFFTKLDLCMGYYQIRMR
jgi:hypothetical protein